MELFIGLHIQRVSKSVCLGGAYPYTELAPQATNVGTDENHGTIPFYPYRVVWCVSAASLPGGGGDYVHVSGGVDVEEGYPWAGGCPDRGPERHPVPRLHRCQQAGRNL